MSRQSKKILVGMSGGVDSSVAAVLLAKQGFEVAGVSLNLLSCDRQIERSCCAPEDRMDAREVCAQMGLGHSVVDCRLLFREAVIDPFVSEYLRGRTPSPCIICNERVKFQALLKEADRQGARYIATGHYARIAGGESFRLLCAEAREKDQSYFLFRMNQEELARTIFPLGAMTKGEVRKTASEFGLATRDKPESQEVCFVPDGDCAAFLEAREGSSIKGPGNFIDARGRVLGRHRGIHAYTIGQRRGLGFGIGRRQYVVRIDPEKNEIVLGSDKELLCSEMTVRDVSWVAGKPGVLTEATVRIRSTHAGEKAELSADEDGCIRVRFERPVRAIAPGQAAVFYREDEVMGGGWIE
ncbi:MAG: tRNA 2-thiouridine(34) synthase MnmA [Pseudomonadota bacterium]